MCLQLLAVMVEAVFRAFERHVRERDEKVLVLDDVHLPQMLLEPAGAGAGLGAGLGIEEVVAAFERALEQAACIVAHAG